MDSPTLDRLRQEIDSIDSDLHGLIERRADLVDRIAASKKGGGGLALRQALVYAGQVYGR